MRDADDADADADGDVDMDGDGEGDGEVDGDGEAEEAPEGEGDEDAESQSNASQTSETFDSAANQAGGAEARPDGIGRGIPDLPKPRAEMLAASTYDIVPTIAAPQSTSINAIAATYDTRWVFSGGSDGYIRRYNWVDSVNGKLMLTVAQRHPFVDSVVKAGVLMSYWENWDSRPKNANAQPIAGPAISPVYSLAVQSQGLWLLSGTESGNIRLQSIRHEEGKEIATLSKHSSAVSVLCLSSDERSLLSGSWDKTVLDWDLSTGSVRTNFASSAGQISAIEPRPISSLPVPAETGELPVTSETFSANTHVNGTANTNMPNGVHSRAESRVGSDRGASGATPDSLFGGDDDDLFGDSTAGVMTNGGLPDAFDEAEDSMAAVIAETDVPAVVPDQDEKPAAAMIEGEADPLPASDRRNDISDQPIPNGVPHENKSRESRDLMFQDNLDDQDETPIQERSAESLPTSDTTFLATSIDGTIRVWDRRQPDPVARILPRSTPPWCLSACWSPDGNSIYAGRRNCTVEEYDLRKGLKGPQRVFKFPQGSGAVTAVKAMPNGRHLIWSVVIAMSSSLLLLLLTCD